MVNKVKFYYGNLQNYKFFIRPQALKLYKTANEEKLNGHQKTIQKILRNFALNGSMSTWEMAKKNFKNDLDQIRTREKEYRRLLLGRTDKGTYSQGILNSGLLEQEEKMYKNRSVASYRLSPHGILFCIDIFDLDNEEIDRMAIKYADILPKIFGQWDFLKKIIGNDVYKIRILSKSMLMDNLQFTELNAVPLYELMSFLSIKYRKNFDYIKEEELAEQISYWFYIFLMYSTHSRKNGPKKLQKMLNHTESIKWFLDFVISANQYYGKRKEKLTEFIDNFE